MPNVYIFKIKIFTIYTKFFLEIFSIGELIFKKVKKKIKYFIFIEIQGKLNFSNEFEHIFV